MFKLNPLISLFILFVSLLFSTSAMPQTNERGIDPRNIDMKVKPCDDFFHYANGNWLKNNPIPPEYSSWSVWNELVERNNKVLHEILENASKNKTASKGSITQKIGDFYATGIDEAKIETDGLSPLKQDLDYIASISNVKELEKAISRYHLSGISVLFDLTIDQDFKDNTTIIAYAFQGGLLLPDRDYYTRKDKESKKLRELYVEHITNMFKLLGDDEKTAKKEADSVMEIEAKLAKASLDNVELRDPYKSYDMKTLSEADSITPNFSWTQYFSTMGLNEIKRFSLSHPKFFKEMNKMLAKTPISEWKNYLRWNVAKHSAPYLTQAFVNEDFRFQGTILQGTKQLKPRWKRVLQVTSNNMGEALGQLYVEKTFPPKAKTRALEMIKNIQAALKDEITNLSWMGDETKKLALKKLSTFTPKIGYPDKWRDYSSLEIDKASYLSNVIKGQAFEVRRQLNKIGKPVDRTEWGMPPQTVNAYYNAQMNDINFPAGILQPPFFDADIDDPVNYGAMGAVIGHEITHGFDDQGSKFDSRGDLKNWWTKDDLKKFESLTDRVAKQYDSYVAIDNLHVNGKFTLGENVADGGGVVLAFKALKKALAGKPEIKIDGFTPEQRFFFAWAQIWRTNFRPEALKLRVNNNEHSPDNFRVIGPLSNMPEFEQAFGCKMGAMLKPKEEQIRIW